ncbi:TPA: hypothetical protein DDZ86_03305 [Candidatus Dependentiae bacterium]|nr:MAG: hypothetical protein UW09_C0003G0014 [candidate division TM6 bacterium GW2011_GWF2_43_87]HBL98644.1 hypothetical protein [Candidatus Dependentiae bacterium]
MVKQVTFSVAVFVLVLCAGCSKRRSEDEPLFNVFDLIEKSLKGVSGSNREMAVAIAKTEGVVKDYIEEALKTDPKGLFDEGEYGLTPAHRLVIDYLWFNRREHWAHSGFDFENPPFFNDEAVRRVVLCALEVMYTEKKVRAYKHWWPAKNSLFNYLETAGIDKTAMSVQEFIAATNKMNYGSSLPENADEQVDEL